MERPLNPGADVSLDSEAELEERRTSLEAWEAAAAERDRVADERDRIADEQGRVADERDRVAD